MRTFSRIKMWTRIQAAAVILLLMLIWPSSSEALTTFGKSATQTPKPAPTSKPGKS